MRTAPVIFVLSLASIVGVSAARAEGWHDPSPHQIRFVTAERGVKIEALDWGGTGRPVILIAGAGGTAHTFDDFAPLLTPRFHTRTHCRLAAISSASRSRRPILSHYRNTPARPAFGSSVDPNAGHHDPSDDESDRLGHSHGASSAHGHSSSDHHRPARIRTVESQRLEYQHRRSRMDAPRRKGWHLHPQPRERRLTQWMTTCS